jgi:RNA polymerase-binding protein DksA
MDKARLQQTLHQHRDELTDRLRRIHQNLRQRDEPVAADFAEQVTEQENVDVLHALEDEGRHELALVERALARLDADEYGLCTRCGEEIAPRRLEALPYAERCIRCADAA